MLGLALIAAAGAGIAVMAAFLGVGRVIESSASLRARLDALAPVLAVEDLDTEASQQGRQLNPVTRTLNRLLSGGSSTASVADELARANLALTVPEYILFRTASVGILFVLTLAFSGQLLIAVLGAVVGFFLPKLYLQRRQTQRLIAFQNQLVDVLSLLVGALRSGYGMTVAMDAVSQQMPPPSSEEFGRVVREIGLGVPAMQALRNLVRRIGSDDLELMVTAIIIQYEVGGNLAEILETISGTIRERIRLKNQLRVLTTLPRLQRTILSAMPFALAALMYVMNPDYERRLFTPGLTLLIPAGAVVLMVIGYVVMGQMTNLDV